MVQLYNTHDLHVYTNNCNIQSNKQKQNNMYRDLLMDVTAVCALNKSLKLQTVTV